jgi:hypothetical protein
MSEKESMNEKMNGISTVVAGILILAIALLLSNTVQNYTADMFTWEGIMNDANPLKTMFATLCCWGGAPLLIINGMKKIYGVVSPSEISNNKPSSAKSSAANC